LELILPAVYLKVSNIQTELPQKIDHFAGQLFESHTPLFHQVVIFKRFAQLQGFLSSDG